MLIYQKTSGGFEWKSVFWFALGVVLGLSAARVVYSGATGGHTAPNATALALQPPPAMRPALAPESTALASPESSPASAAVSRSLARETPRIATRTVQTDVSLARTSDADRHEMAPQEPAPDASTQVKPPDTASAVASVPSQADIDLESDLRSQSESTAARIPSATDAALLPHERL